MIDWEGALERVRAGEHITQLHLSPNMPTKEQWKDRRRRYPAFRAAADEALGNRACKRHDEATYDLILELLGQRLPLRQILARPGMPDKKTLRERRRRDPAYNQKILELIKLRKGKRAARVDWAEALRHIRAGTPIENLQRVPGMPRPSSWYKRYSRDPVFKRQGVAALRQGAKQRAVAFDKRLDEAARAIGGGYSNAELREFGLPCMDTLYRHRRLDEGLDGRVRDALRVRRAAHRTPAPARPLLSDREIFAAVDAAISRGLPDFIRDDVRSEMIADVLEGHLGVADLGRAASAYLRDYNRSFGGYRDLSLDAPVGYGDERSRYELIG